MRIKDKVSNLKDAQYQKYYRENYRNCVSREIYRNVWKDVIQQLIHLCITENYEIKFTHGLGTFRIIKYKVKVKFKPNGEIDRKNSFVVDWNETFKLWKNDEEAKEKRILVYYTNEHSDGYYLAFKWIKPKNRIIKKYCCRASDDNKITLGRNALSGKIAEDFSVITHLNKLK